VSAQVLCGRCGAVLPRPHARCATCGAEPAASGARPRKSPIVAAALSALLPGLGHLYLGRVPKAAGMFAAIGGLEFLGFDLDLTGIGALLGVPMELSGFGLWLYGIADAYRVAKAMQVT
jgi:hypothetical protein